VRGDSSSVADSNVWIESSQWDQDYKAMSYKSLTSGVITTLSCGHNVIMSKEGVKNISEWQQKSHCTVPALAVSSDAAKSVPSAADTAPV
jgi:hypothetical protein